MKIASSSLSFDKCLLQGDLTQLEWLQLCASTLALDGVVFEARHFPRTDDEYLAQLKKTATDIGLTVAAVAADALLEPDGLPWIEIAVRLGAPIVVARAPRAAGAPEAWNELVANLRKSASAAKRANIVIALRDDPGTICANPADLKRAAKDVDSSWVRFGLDIAKLSSEQSAATLLSRTVIGFLGADSADDEGSARLLRDLKSFRAFVVIEAIDGHMTEQGLASFIERVRGQGLTVMG
jgi:sugar phosphate isomerase/epimerase